MRGGGEQLLLLLLLLLLVVLGPLYHCICSPTAYMLSSADGLISSCYQCRRQSRGRRKHRGKGADDRHARRAREKKRLEVDTFLSSDITSLIISFLDIVSIVRLSMVNHRLHRSAPEVAKLSLREWVLLQPEMKVLLTSSRVKDRSIWRFCCLISGRIRCISCGGFIKFDLFTQHRLVSSYANDFSRDIHHLRCINCAAKSLICPDAACDYVDTMIYNTIKRKGYMAISKSMASQHSNLMVITGEILTGFELIKRHYPHVRSWSQYIGASLIFGMNGEGEICLK